MTASANAVEQALETHDLVAINAGSSAGSEDYTSAIVRELGELRVHGIAVRPGHPVVLGVAPGKALVGVPGYPVSAAMTFEVILKPLLYRWQGLLPPENPRIDATLTRKVLSPMGDDDYLRVTVGKVGERMVATPLGGGAGVLMSLVKADGIVTIPRFSEGHDAGETVQVELLRPLSRIENTIVAIGSHDMTLDVLADQLRRTRPELTLSSAHVGSLSGLLGLAARRGASGRFAFAGRGDGRLQHRLHRAHPDAARGARSPAGLCEPRAGPHRTHEATPRNITALDDLLREDVVFVNRQRGAGTRVLLDYALQQRGPGRAPDIRLSAAGVHAPGRGRRGEEWRGRLRVGHSGRGACAGHGLRAPLPRALRPGDPGGVLRERAAGPAAGHHPPSRTRTFVAAVQALGGYDTAQMGEVLAEL